MKAGYDDAIMLNTEGYVAEGSGENLFILRDGVLHTPPESSGILPGITRDSVIQIARDLGYEVLERKLTRGELYTADEAFYTGTAAEVCPIKEVDDRAIGDSGRGPITKELQETFYATVRGELPQYEAWVEHVD